MMQFMIKKYWIFLQVFLGVVVLEARLPEIGAADAKKKFDEIMQGHASHKKLTAPIAKRIVSNYLNELDPTKTYFLHAEIEPWLEPTDRLLEKILRDYESHNFEEFRKIHETLVKAVDRRRRLEKEIDVENLPQDVKIEEFKDLIWLETEEELLVRLERIKALQLEAAAKLEGEMKERSLQRIAKRRTKLEEEILQKDPILRERYILAHFLKAAAQGLDSQTLYFTPYEAQQFMIGMQQRMFGIGAQLRDDLNGFTVMKIVEGSPAAKLKVLKEKDRIVAVDGEPVVGMDIIDAVGLIRGTEGTPVTLTIIRQVKEGEEVKEEKLDVTLVRGEVVLKEARYEEWVEPFGDGVISYLRLFTFYEDPDSSSAKDLRRVLKRMQEEHRVLGVVLDLRSNAGGLLTEAVELTGLFITKGVVVSIKDASGRVQHLRDTDGEMLWGGPLVILVDRGSASAAEIVAQTLKDYGRALIVGDETTYGKGSFQTFTLLPSNTGEVNPQGEYKVTRGRYYTVSGTTPQLNGVESDMVVPGYLSEAEIGERYAKYPLESDRISASFDDDLSDLKIFQRERMRAFYKPGIQKREVTYEPYKDSLAQNSAFRLNENKNYQAFLKELKKKGADDEEAESEPFGQNDLQLNEAMSIMKDLILMMN